MNICVFCSANDLDEKYTKPAEKLASLLARAGHTLVWGGSNYGLMKVMADGVRQNGGKIVGVSMELFKEYARQDADELVVAKNLSERKTMLLGRADAVVVLVGGLGTLDEMAEILELKKQRQHNKLVIVLNTDGFYNGLKMQLERIASEGFLPVKEHYGIKFQPLQELVRFVDTPERIMNLIGEVFPPDSNQSVPSRHS